MKRALVLVAVGLSFWAYGQNSSFILGDHFSETAPHLDLEALEGAFNLDGERTELLGEGPCAQISLTDEQKGLLKTAFIEHKKAGIQLEADMKIAKIDYLVAITDVSVEKEAATLAASALASTAGAGLGSHLSFANDVLYDILTTEQRRPALMCAALIKRMLAKHKLHKLCKDYESGGY